AADQHAVRVVESILYARLDDISRDVERALCRRCRRVQQENAAHHTQNVTLHVALVPPSSTSSSQNCCSSSVLYSTTARRLPPAPEAAPESCPQHERISCRLSAEHVRLARPSVNRDTYTVRSGSPPIAGGFWISHPRSGEMAQGARSIRRYSSGDRCSLSGG